MPVVTQQMIFDTAWDLYSGIDFADESKIHQGLLESTSVFGATAAGNALPIGHPARAETKATVLSVCKMFPDVMYEDIFWCEQLGSRIDYSVRVVAWKTRSKEPTASFDARMREIAGHFGLCIPGTQVHAKQDHCTGLVFESIAKMQLLGANPAEVFEALTKAYLCMLSSEDDQTLQAGASDLVKAIRKFRVRVGRIYGSNQGE